MKVVVVVVVVVDVVVVVVTLLLHRTSRHPRFDDRRNKDDFDHRSRAKYELPSNKKFTTSTSNFHLLVLKNSATFVCTVADGSTSNIGVKRPPKF